MTHERDRLSTLTRRRLLTGAGAAACGAGRGAGRASTVATIASPLRLQGTPPVYYRAPPALGDATDAVLTDLLGMARDQVERLRKDGIV